MVSSRSASGALAAGSWSRALLCRLAAGADLSGLASLTAAVLLAAVLRVLAAGAVDMGANGLSGRMVQDDASAGQLG
ncbi:hypothetical protein ABEP27_12140, partial [Cutibacterium acnes]